MVEGFWKTRDNGGKAAWLFIGVLSSVYWVSDVITDDELAVLIIRACSSRNLFVKHHFTSSHLLNIDGVPAGAGTAAAVGKYR